MADDTKSPVTPEHEAVLATTVCLVAVVMTTSMAALVMTNCVAAAVMTCSTVETALIA